MPKSHSIPKLSITPLKKLLKKLGEYFMLRGSWRSRQPRIPFTSIGFISLVTLSTAFRAPLSTSSPNLWVTSPGTLAVNWKLSGTARIIPATVL
ncbi:MAG: hypothetical protein QXD24_01995 [Candidatus Caldarchaeum sp.]